jgi:hypothetical protein
MPRLRTILGWALVIILVIAFVQNPAGFAHVVSGTAGLLKQAGNSVATFFNSL